MFENNTANLYNDSDDTTLSTFLHNTQVKYNCIVFSKTWSLTGYWYWYYKCIFVDTWRGF